jgi:hypothetical protein
LDSLWFLALVILTTKPLSLVFYLAGDTTLALCAFVLPAIAGTIHAGPALAVLHNRVPPTLRPTASALFLIFLNLVGLGLGPLCVGMMSQWLFAGSSHALGYALAVMQIAGVWGAVHFLVAGQKMASSA